MQFQSPVAVLVASDTGTTGAGAGAATGTATTAGAGVAATGVVVAVLAAATSPASSESNAPRPAMVAGRLFDVFDELNATNWEAFVIDDVDVEDLLGAVAAACEVTGRTRTAVLMAMIDATVKTAMSAMRVRMAPPFVGRAMAPSSARCWRAPAIAFGPRTASGKASFVLALRRRVCGRLVYAQDCFVVSSLFVIGLRTPARGHKPHVPQRGRADLSGVRTDLPLPPCVIHYPRMVGLSSDSGQSSKFALAKVYILDVSGHVMPIELDLWCSQDHRNRSRSVGAK